MRAGPARRGRSGGRRHDSSLRVTRPTVTPQAVPPCPVGRTTGRADRDRVGREAAPTDGIGIPRVDPGADGVGWSAMDAQAAWSCVIGALLTPHRQFRPGGGWTVPPITATTPVTMGRSRTSTPRAPSRRPAPPTTPRPRTSSARWCGPRRRPGRRRRRLPQPDRGAPGRDVGGSNAPISRMVGPDSLRVGTWGAAIVDGLDPREDELVLDGGA